MVANAPFLNTPYGGYLHSQVPLEDDELTHVGPGTRGGEWLRRFWLPVAVSEDLKDLPLRIRILREDLVIFRDRSGQVGLLELHCSHRGTSLEFGQIEERGIRCCHHAWCYDVDGKLLETPGEPAESTLKERLYHGAYPTVEHKGLVFAYMGPPDKRPAFPIYDTDGLPGYHLDEDFSSCWPCNWLQIRENIMDPAHLTFLHGLPGNTFLTDDFKFPGELDYMETPLGMVCIESRRVGDYVWLRNSDYIVPNLQQTCSIRDDIQQRDWNRPNLTIWSVPIDDTNTLRIGYQRTRVGEAFGKSFGQELDRSYEERQRVPGDYDALVGQRAIAVHALEHLANTDRGVIMMRSIVREGIRGLQRGDGPADFPRNEAGITPTYSHDRVLQVPPGPTPDQDRKLLRDTGRKVMLQHIKTLS